MILEVAPLQVRVGQEAAFEAAFLEAQRIIASMPGYASVPGAAEARGDA
jgi:heme-degrading monooxygenase HmoA